MIYRVYRRPESRDNSTLRTDIAIIEWDSDTGFGRWLRADQSEIPTRTGLPVQFDTLEAFMHWQKGYSRIWSPVYEDEDLRMDGGL